VVAAAIVVSFPSLLPLVPFRLKALLSLRLVVLSVFVVVWSIVGLFFSSVVRHSFTF
jgi:hypothetical protein